MRDDVKVLGKENEHFLAIKQIQRKYFEFGKKTCINMDQLDV
jgi:hypothetical protein